MNTQTNSQQTEGAVAVRSGDLLAADSAAETIREIHAHLLEKHDVGWTELAVLTAKEYAESLHVPQYDVELRLAGEEIAKWKEIARRLYLALGCKKNEHLRIQAEAAYLSAKAANDQAMPQEERRQ